MALSTLACMAMLSCISMVSERSDIGRSIGTLSPEEVREKTIQDYRSILRHHEGLEGIHAFMKARRDIFRRPSENNRSILNSDERDIVLGLWRSMLDYFMALDSLRRYHARYYLAGDRDLQYSSFLCYLSSFVTQYRYALEFLSITERDRSFEKILNEPLPEIGLGKDSYAQFKFRYLNVAAATEFASLHLLYKGYRIEGYRPAVGPVNGDIRRIWGFGKGKGIAMTAANALALTRKSAEVALFPVQSGVAEWMGDTKVWRLSRSLISRGQLEELMPRLEPGDILMERREWYLSNIGLPGFWPHAALYIGTADERRRFFDDPGVREWLEQRGVAGGDIETLLEKRYPAAYREFLTNDASGHPHRVIEAMSEGVLFTSLEHSGDCDALAVLRPRLTKAERAEAILTAFSYQGRPYDFNFDFMTDRTIVCTELIYKSYQPRGGFRGIPLMLITMMGRRVLPANEIVRQYVLAEGTALQRMDLVAFLDGIEKEGRAIESAAGEFRKSWQRPRWRPLRKGQDVSD
ncbi:MAG: hypothetical protein JXA20_18570 [Spirochaetes bacterium]|nr:hypothetical protein [Spirochaetota bacterium]